MYVKGARHTNVSDDETLFVGGQIQIEAKGNVTIVVNGNVYQQVNGSMHTTVKGAYNVTAGTINMKATSTISIAGATTNVQSGATAADPANKTAYSPSIYEPSPITAAESEFISISEGDDNVATRLKDDAVFYPTTPTTTKPDTKEPPKVPDPIPSTCDFTSGLAYNTQLSPNFKLGDLCFDQGRPFPFEAANAKTIACNMKHLCENVLEPLRAKFADFGFKLNSGFRNGSGKSQHYTGQAADISFSKIRGVGSYDQQCAAFYAKAVEIRDSGIPFDQMIFECDPARGWVWIHVSFNDKGNRPSSDPTKIMTYVATKGYKPGLMKVSGGTFVV